MSTQSPTNSFSLPSAGGMVSLLNNDSEKDGNGRIDEHRKVHEHNHHHHHRQEQRPEQRLKVPHYQHRSTSSSLSSSPSPFQTSGSESNGSLTAATAPSTESSRDDSFACGKRSRRVSEDEPSVGTGEGAETENKSDGQAQRLPHLPPRTDTAYSSSPSLDDEQSADRAEDEDEHSTKKRRRQSDSRADETVQSRGVSMRNMLHTSRLAQSPPPMRGADNEQGERRVDLAAGGTQEVPMNMHRATAKDRGGFGGSAELDDSRDLMQQDYDDDDGDAQTSHQRRGSVDSMSSISKLSSAGRKGNSSSQIIGGKKRYPCSFPGCEKTFSTSGHAARHNRIHTGSKPYRCTFPGCCASFSRQDNSLQHYRTHVLHPKSRTGGSVNLDTTQVDAVVVDKALANLDPEMVATVQMGRKALEDGTAIAVVQEFIDGNGRRGEAVQRMVGQPKSARRGSGAYNDVLDAVDDWADYGPAATRRMMSLEPHAAGPEFESQPPRWQAPLAHDSSPYPPPPSMHAVHRSPYHPYEGDRYYAESSRAQQPEYAPHPHAGRHHHPAAYPMDATHGQHQHAPPLPPSHAAPLPPSHAYGGEYNRYPPYGAPPHAEYTRPGLQYAMPAATSSPYSRAPEYAPENGGRVRRSSEVVGIPSGSAYPSSAYGPSHYRSVHESAYSAPPQPPGADRHHASLSPPTPMTLTMNGHRRTASATVAPPYGTGMPPYDGHGRAPPVGPHGGEAIDAPSPSYSVRSFRSEGPPYAPVAGPRDDRGSALSLLSSAAVRGGSGAASSIISSKMMPTAMARSSPHSAGGGMRSRTTTGDMHLPLPPAGMSKVPCSSDRSTNVLTPTTPMSDAAPHSSAPSRSYAMYGGMGNRIAVPPYHRGLDGPELAPLRSTNGRPVL